MTELRSAASAEPAEWVIERTHGFAENVGSLVPHGFEAYARVLHPAGSGYPDDKRVTWAEIARSTGRVVHPEAQWPHVAFRETITDMNDLQDPPPGAPWRSAPEEGSLDQSSAGALAEILRGHTQTPDRCWFAIWDGWGSVRPEIKRAPTFELPGRRYYLLEGALDAISVTASVPEWSYQSASLWWPDDRAWCVATEVDLESTYVGGTAACIDTIIGQPILESMKVQVTHGMTWAADTLNPNPLRLEG